MLGAHALPSVLADLYEAREAGAGGYTDVVRDGLFYAGPQN